MNLKKLKELNVPELDESGVKNVIENIKLLNDEEREDYLYYLMDDVYYFDEDNEVDNLNNKNVIEIMRTVKEDVEKLHKQINIDSPDKLSEREELIKYINDLESVDRTTLTERELVGLDKLLEYETNKLAKL